jgi:hypothetical protein
MFSPRTVRQSSSKEEDIHRYPSAPNLCEEDDHGSHEVLKPSAIAARRSSCLPKFRNRVPPVLFRQAMSIDCSSSSPFLPITPRPANLSQAISASSGSCGHYKVRRGIYRSNTNTSSETIRRGSASGEASSPNSQQPTTSRAVSSLSVDNPSSSSTVRASGTVDLHLPNGMVTLNVIHTTGGSVLGGSSTCLRALSPHPSYHSQSDDSSFDMGSVKSDNVLIPKSPMKSYKYRSESFGGRPTLVSFHYYHSPCNFVLTILVLYL